MTTTTVDAERFSKVWENLDPSGAPFLREWRERVSITKPYKGLKIYHNIPLSIETLVKLETLHQAGAEVVVSNTDTITPATFPEAREVVDSVGLEFRETKHAEVGEFDFYLDCCAELSDLPPPKYGAVELTRTGAIVYAEKQVPCPVISVDDSRLKALETFYGTGEAFLRAFKEQSGRDPAKETFAVVGYGKVGQGVAHWVDSIGAKAIIFDVDPKACEVAKKRGFEAYLCGGTEGVAALETVTTLVTATGRRDVLQGAFPDAETVLAGKTLCNIGVEDEIGSGFDQSEILADGIIINFTLRHPTVMRYLDPSFYAHNIAIDLLRENSLSNGFHPFPEALDQSIVGKWGEIHSEPVDMI